MRWLTHACVWAVAVSCSPSTESSFPLRARVLAALRDARPLDARVSETSRHTTCASNRTRRRLPSARCIAEADPRTLDAVSAVSVDVRTALDGNPSTDALWSAALLDLWSAGGETRTLDRVIGRLAEVRARDTTNAAVLNDLAAAHLARASDRDDARDLFMALDYAEQAYARDSTSRAISFNRAVILERARIDRQAEAAWQAVARSEPNEDWAAEARERYARLARPDRIARVSIEQIDRPTVVEGEALSALVRRDPQTAREYVLDTLLIRWSRAILDRDSASAKSSLTRAMVIARELCALSGDSSVLHVGGEIERAAAHPHSRTEVATAVSAGGNGIRLFRQTLYLEAQPLLMSATAALRRDALPVLADWAELSLAGVHLQRADYAGAERIFAAVAGRARSRHALAVEARARWGLALSQGRRGATSETEVSYSIAVDRFAQLGETSNVGFMQALVADIHHALGRSALHAHAMYASLDAFHQRADPPLHFAVLLSLGQRLSDRGLRHAAVAAIREAVLVARTTGRVKDTPESQARLALEQARLGRTALAQRSVALARDGLAGVKDSVMRARLDAEISRAEAEAYRGDDPRRALERLDRVAEYFAAAAIPVDLAPTLIARADADLALGDSARALADLDAATGVVATLLSRQADRETVRLLMGTQSDVYRRLVAVALARADTMSAFRYAELSREDTLVSRDHLVPTSPDMASDRALVSYLALDDKLLIWTSRANNEPMLTVVAVRPEELSELVTRFVNLIREDADARTEAEVGCRLYDLLVAPVRGRLTGVRHLLFVTDAAVAGVPFAALRDAQGRYLIQDFSLTYASRVERHRAPHASAGASAVRALFVGNPAWERSLFPDLDPLRSAELEVDNVRALYEQSIVLNGAEATRGRFLRELSGRTLLHFAGHARIATDDAMSSHLVLARDSSGFGANVIFATDIARLDLRTMRLAILSACGAAQDRYAGSVTNGLVQAFLDAGVAGVISSQWEADDEGTADLMRVLHVRLRAGVAPEEALRQAQVTYLERSGERRVASRRTRIWSTFRFSTD